MTLDLQPGVSFGDYFLERRLGGGGFGDVWLARSATGGYVALKVLNGHYQGSEVARVRAEIEMLAAAASSSSSHIVRVLGGGSDPAPFVVMEYIEGIDLGREIARRGTLPVAEVIRIASAVTDALGTLQLAGIIHRDVKPANVMIDKQGVVKLTDFGIAKIVGIDSATATSQMPMSMAYAAPEVWEGKASYLSDHYAFGALLYQCLTGRPPFTGSYAEVYRHHVQSEPDLSALPADTPLSLRALIGSCLAKDQEDRPPNAPAIQAALDAAENELRNGTNQTMIMKPATEPKQLGPWLIDHRSPDRAWTFICHHEATYEDAVVELHFGADLDYGLALRKAVEVNPKLVPLGAEKLISTSRFVPRPDEAWSNPPPGAFQFWVARVVLPRPPAVEVNAEALHAAAESLRSMIKLAADEGVNLSLRAENVWFSPSGRIHVERPGLPPFDDADPYAAADAWLSSEIARLSPSNSQTPANMPEASAYSSSFQVPSFAAREETPPVQHHAWDMPEESTGERISDIGAQPRAIDVVLPDVPPLDLQEKWRREAEALRNDQSQPDVPTPTRAPASFGRRTGAFLIDSVAIVVLWFMSFVLIGFVTAILGSNTESVPGWLLWPITFGAFPVYHFAFVASPARRTIGMMALDMHVVLDRNRGPVTPTEALTRAVVLYIGSVFFIGCLWMLWDSKQQTLHDKASSTDVVH